MSTSKTVSAWATEDSAAELAAAAKAHGSERERLREDVVRRHLPLARALAHRYAGRGVPLDDLQQVAAVGLVKAVNGYNPEISTEFVGYAVLTIKGELRRHFRDCGWTVRPPRRLQELQWRISAAEGELTQRLHRPARPEEIAQEVGAEVDDVIECLAAEGCFRPLSLDAPRASGDGTAGDDLGGQDPDFARTEARVVVHQALGSLSERDQAIVKMRFGEELTQDEIGQRIGVTQMQVSRLLTRILGDLRRNLSDTDYPMAA